jgi:hypothetical protein
LYACRPFLRAKKVSLRAKKVFGSAKKVFRSAKKVFGSAKKVFGSAKKVFLRAKKVFGNAKKVFWNAEKRLFQVAYHRYEYNALQGPFRDTPQDACGSATFGVQWKIFPVITHIVFDSFLV